MINHVVLDIEKFTQEKNKIHNLSLQLEMKKTLITLYNARILSGAYKQSNLSHGTWGENTPFTDDEKLKHDMDILHKHVQDVIELTNELMV